MNKYVKEAVNAIMKELEETGSLSYTSTHHNIAIAMQKAILLLTKMEEPCWWEDEEDDLYDTDNGPTGHGDICYSDADSGL